MKRRPGDRRKHWNSSCTTSGIILLLIGAFFCTAGGMGYVMGLGAFWAAYMEFRDRGRGWPISDKRPQWADRHDAIDRGDLTLYKRYPHWKTEHAILMRASEKRKTKGGAI